MERWLTAGLAADGTTAAYRRVHPPPLAAGSHRGRAGRDRQPGPARHGEQRGGQPPAAQPGQPGSAGQEPGTPDRRAERAVRRAAHPAHRGPRRGQDRDDHVPAGRQQARVGAGRDRPARRGELHERRPGHPAAGPHVPGLRLDAQPGRDHAAAADRERRPGQRARHRRGGCPPGARHRRAAGDQGDHPGQDDGGQEAGHPGQGEQAQQRGVLPGHEHLPAHRQLPEHQPAHRQHGRRGGAAVRDDPAGRPVRVGRGGPGHLRLLRAGDVGVRAGRHQPAALHRSTSTTWASTSPGASSSRAIWCSSTRTSTTSASTSATA